MKWETRSVPNLARLQPQPAMTAHAKGPQWTVTSAEGGLRLDKFLAAPERLGSRSKAATALSKGKVFLDDEEAAPDAGSRVVRERRQQEDSSCEP